MKALRAERMRIKLGDHWESPALHILLTQEDDVVIARCLDFTVSSHGQDEQDALRSLANAIGEYIATAVESGALDSVFDPAHGKYWRMFDEAESRKSMTILRQSLERLFIPPDSEIFKDSTLESCYA
jgi:predicted RNase H-like HicB family nuclease